MIPAADVDFEALKQIDREIDDALEQDKWSAERFITLHKRAVYAAAGLEDSFGFLLEVGEPSWTVGGHHGGGLRRLPRRVRELIRLLSEGWEPFFELPSGHSLRWNNEDLDVSEVEVRLKADEAELTVLLTPGANENFLEMQQERGVIRDTLDAELAHGWKLTSPNAVRISTTFKSEHQVAYHFLAQQVCITRGESAPSIWLVPLGSGISLPVSSKNVHRASPVFTKFGMLCSAGAIGVHLRGAFQYTLVECPQLKKNFYYLIIETPNEKFDAAAVDRDLLALQYALGQCITPGLAYGLQETKVTAVRYIYQWANCKSRAKTVPEIDHQCPWVIDLFEHLSVALRGPRGDVMAAVLHSFLQSLDTLIDTSAQELLSGIALLTYDPSSLILRTYGERAFAYLAAHGIKLPAVVLSKIDDIATKLAVRGSITVGADAAELDRYLSLPDQIRSVLTSMIAATVGYQGPIMGDVHRDYSPSWWPDFGVLPSIPDWSASLPPTDERYDIKVDQILVLGERPEHIIIARWALRAAGIPSERLLFSSTFGHQGLLKAVDYAKNLGERLIVVADASSRHIPTAIEGLRTSLALSASAVLICPAVPCVEAWLFADDELARHQKPDAATLRRTLECLPEELSDARALAHRIFGSADLWSRLPIPDVYRAAERSPSLRRFLVSLKKILGIEEDDLPAQSVSRAISRDAIAGLIRDLLAEDTIAWRTSDDSKFTAEELAREVEQGTETGRQYTVDLIAMMINTLSRKARIKDQK